MIRTESISKNYCLGDVEIPALKNISITINKGEFIGIMGPSGSGKSTLLHLLGLLDFQSGGRIWINNVDLSTLTDDERTEYRLRNLGYVFQDYALIQDLTVLENIILPAMARGVDSSEYSMIARGIIDAVGLDGIEGHLIHQLSGGQQQRVAVARALINHPYIILADEPCANLDTINSKAVLELFKKLNQEYNQTIIMVSHEGWHTPFFDRIIDLEDGSIR